MKYLPERTWDSINTCRIYLHAVTISDITSFDGNWIPKKLYQVTEPIRNSWLKYPRQTKPTKTDITVWQHFIQRISTEKRKLLLPLGKWHPNPYKQFPYILNLDTGDILRKGEKVWTVYSKHNTSRNRYISTTIITDKIPENWSPVHVIRVGDMVDQSLISLWHLARCRWLKQ